MNLALSNHIILDFILLSHYNHEYYKNRHYVINILRIGDKNNENTYMYYNLISFNTENADLS